MWLTGKNNAVDTDYYSSDNEMSYSRVLDLDEESHDPPIFDSVSDSTINNSSDTSLTTNMILR